MDIVERQLSKVLSALNMSDNDLWLKFLAVSTATAASATSTVVGYVLYNLRYYFFPRKHQFVESYPFEATLFLMRAVSTNTVLEAIWGLLTEAKQKFNRKTVIVNTLGISHFVFTGNIENVTHILKTNFENFGKAGPEFKPKFQGLLGDGIFNADGHTWYAHRKTSALIFKLNRFKTSVLEVFHDDMDQAIEWIRSQNNKSFDFHALMHRYTLESIARIAFGIQFDIIRKERVEFAEDFDYCTWAVNNSMVDPLWWFKRYFTISGWKYFQALGRINTFTQKIIQERKANIAANGGQVTADMNDLLSLYLAHDTVVATTTSAEKGTGYQRYDDTYLSPTDATLRDVILNMIIAGRDTTAQALSWAFYRMCLHDDIQSKLRTEISTILQQTGEYTRLRERQGLGTVQYDTLQQLKYVEAFIFEVLRLHPSVPKEGKCVFQDDILPDGTQVKKGDVVSFLPWCMGRDADLWGEDCLEFKPERFLHQTSKPSPFVFIAFQAGPRTCLGQNFALLEMKTVLVRLLVMFDFSFAQDPHTIRYENSLTLPMRGGMQLVAKEI